MYVNAFELSNHLVLKGHFVVSAFMKRIAYLVANV